MVFFPALIFGLSWVFRYLPPCPWGRIPAAALWVLELLLGAILIGLTWYLFKMDEFFLIQHNPFFRRPFKTFPLLVGILAVLWWVRRENRYFRWGLNLLGVTLVLMIFLGSITDEKDPYAFNPHFLVVFNPLVQLQQGRALLIDANSQYGLYPHFLQPLFALVGLSVVKFTVVMGLISALSFGGLWLCLRQATRLAVVAGMGFFALVFHTWYNRVPDSATECYVDFYYQYYPIRFLFPALAVMLAWRYFHRPSRRLYWGAMVLLAAGVLWNADSGLPAFLAWLSVLGFSELYETGVRNKVRRLAFHAAAGGVTLLAVIGAYGGYIVLCYGAVPHVQEFLHYQTLFYLAGFCMLPMPLLAPWMVVILVYLSGLAYAAAALAGNQSTPRAKLVFLLSVLGGGLFSYYQGRSCSLVLELAWWPCFPLLAIFLDELLTWLQVHWQRPLPWLAALLVVWVLAGSSWNIFNHSRFLCGWISQHLQLARTSTHTIVDEDVALVKHVVPPGEELLVVGCREPYVHLKSGRRSLLPGNLFQLLLMEDFANTCTALDHRPAVTVLIEKGFYEHVHWKNRGAGQLVQFLRNRYRVTAQTRDCYFLQYDGGRHTQAPGEPPPGEMTSGTLP
jgi:hypothetical protein